MLCDQLSRWPNLHGVICGAGADGDWTGLLAALGEPEQDRMLAWAQGIEDACARKGLASITSREHALRPLPTGMFAAPDSRAWVCLRGRCDRVVLPEEVEHHRYARWPAERR